MGGEKLIDNLGLFLQSVAVFFLLVILVQFLKRQGVFDDSHQKIFNRFITELILPVTIFSTLAVSIINIDHIIAAVVMFFSALVCWLISYIFCRLLGFSDKLTGAVVVISGVGCTSTLAYPLISQTYGMDSEAMSFGIMAGELGVVVPTITVGVLVLIYFGSSEKMNRHDLLPVIKNLLKMPMFIAFVLGIVFSQVSFLSGIMGSWFVGTLSGYFISGLEMMVAISVGLMLRPVKLRFILPVLLMVGVLKLIIQPLIVFFGSGAAGLNGIPLEVLVIEASMPAGAIAAVLADRYGCDGNVASVMVIATYLISLATIPVIIMLLV